MKCKFCDEDINSISFYELIFERDTLCKECRSKLNFKHRIYKYKDIEIEYFYDYNQMFQTLLIQYKECYDEALFDVFLYKIDNYINFRYFNYHLLLAPSSKSKTTKRGFNHLEKMFSSVWLKRVKGLNAINDINQQGKSSYQRSLMKDNYKYTGPKLNKVLIVDDLSTTGSTLRGIYKAIKPYSKRVKFLVLAKTE